MANRLTQPMKDLDGVYGTSSWPGYKFKETLGYTSGKHTGVDYNGGGGGNNDLGYGAYAIGDGKVLKVVPQSSKYPGFGNTLIYELTNKDLIKRMGLSGKRVFVRYMHINKFLVKEGQTIKLGQRIAEVGKTGTDWAHLHADMWHSGNGLGVHMAYHKDTALASYLDIYRTVEKYKTEPKPAPKPAPKPVPKPTPAPKPTKDQEQDKKIEDVKKEVAEIRSIQQRLVDAFVSIFSAFKK